VIGIVVSSCQHALREGHDVGRCGQIPVSVTPEVTSGTSTGLNFVDEEDDAVFLRDVSKALSELGTAILVTTFGLNWLGDDDGDIVTLKKGKKLAFLCRSELTFSFCSFIFSSTSSRHSLSCASLYALFSARGYLYRGYLAIGHWKAGMSTCNVLIRFLRIRGEHGYFYLLIGLASRHRQCGHRPAVISPLETKHGQIGSARQFLLHAGSEVFVIRRFAASLLRLVPKMCSNYW